MVEQLTEILKKIPAMLLLAVFFGYLGYDYYEFTNDPSSPLIQKQQQLDAAQKQTADLKEQLRKAAEFYKTLEQRRAVLRDLATQLEDIKATVSEQFDNSALIKMVVGEAGKVGLNVSGLKPTDLKESEFYAEQAFNLTFHAVYVQLVVFLDRLANLKRIVRVDEFQIKTASSQTAQYVELEGTLQLKSYRYKGSKADELGKEGAASNGAKPGQAINPSASPVPASASGAAPTAASKASPGVATSGGHP